jgi:hypothetical protein
MLRTSSDIVLNNVTAASYGLLGFSKSFIMHIKDRVIKEKEDESGRIF